MNILVINNGSSSLKFAIYSPIQSLCIISGMVEGIGTSLGKFKINFNENKTEIKLKKPTHLSAILALQNYLMNTGAASVNFQAIGHRVVHGGEYFKASVIINDTVIKGIIDNSALAPLHNPANLLGIKATLQTWPKLKQVAVFDTAFHQDMPEKAFTYAIPYELYQKYGIRKYGFHGTSHRFVSAKAANTLKKPIKNLALITAHLGNGGSCAAILAGKSIDTTMGFTPLEGLVMGTRSGDLDPGIFAYLNTTKKWSTQDINKILNKNSGLLGLSEFSQDMRELVKARAKGHLGSKLAIDVFVYRLAKSIAALTVPLGRVDALIFTGGIGENSPSIRAEVIENLKIFGFKIDSHNNENISEAPNGIITKLNSTIAMVVKTDEELLIAQDTQNLINP